MKSRSTALYAFLSEAGVLNGTPDEIARARCLYRKEYKRKWKQRKQQSKELRIAVTQTQFDAIIAKAKTYGMKHTVYARSTVLQAVGIQACPIGKHQLQQVLQLLGMAVIGTTKQTFSIQQVAALVQQAEAILIPYAINP